MDSSRPSDHIDQDAPPPADPTVAQPRLNVIGYLRYFWRQLTSMRTALFLLLLLAVAAIPGSLVPQRSSDPNGVIQYQQQNPGSYKVLNALQVFDTYSSFWFSAVYLLLFISLIGCVIPRTKHHWEALRARPPKTPARLARLVGYRDTMANADPAASIELASRMLKRQGYRVETYSDSSGVSVSAERGYLRETGNLVFHAALIGVLITVGVGSGFAYTGQKVIIQGQAFTNVLAYYDSFNPGRWVNSDSLVPYSLQLKSFDASYTLGEKGVQPVDYTANMLATTANGKSANTTIKVNSPLDIGDTNVYLLGNGYAPVITVRDGEGNVAFSQAVPFLAQDANLTSLGVVKVPDALPKQIGLQGFFYPSPTKLSTGAITSAYPDATKDALLSLNVYTGDLGLDNGIPRNVYQLNTDNLTKVAGVNAPNKAIELTIGQTAKLPDGLGTVTFSGLKRYVGLDIHHDPTQDWILLFAILVLGGLITSLFVPRRRIWVKAAATTDGVRLEYAGLARGDDPTLEAAIADFAAKHSKQLAPRMNS